MLVKFLVGPDGRVRTASLVQTTLANAELEACLINAVRQWSFEPPKTGGVAIVTAPFFFEGP